MLCSKLVSPSGPRSLGLRLESPLEPRSLKDIGTFYRCTALGGGCSYDAGAGSSSWDWDMATISCTTPTFKKSCSIYTKVKNIMNAILRMDLCLTSNENLRVTTVTLPIPPPSRKWGFKQIIVISDNRKTLGPFLKSLVPILTGFVFPLGWISAESTGIRTSKTPIPWSTRSPDAPMLGGSNPLRTCQAQHLGDPCNQGIPRFLKGWCWWVVAAGVWDNFGWSCLRKQRFK